MKVRELYDTIQSGDLSVISEVTDVLGEVADVIDWLRDANWQEQLEAGQHIKNLDHGDNNNSGSGLSSICVNDWF